MLKNALLDGLIVGPYSKPFRKRRCFSDVSILLASLKNTCKIWFSFGDASINLEFIRSVFVVFWSNLAG